ncbi:MAG TPA: DNA polymerase III subunit beta [Chloroflexota bacterium]
MKLSCLQENLDKGLNIVGKAVPAKSTLPALSNVLMTTDQGRLKLAATNLEVAISCWIGAKVEEEGAITVPANLLSEFVRSLPNDRIDVDLSERTRTVHLHCARFEANIKGLDAEEFPSIPSIGEGFRIAIDSATLHDSIAQVAFAAASDDSRPVLTGVLINFAADTMTMVAADGFRMAMKTSPLAAPVDQEASVIVPARAMRELGRILADSEETVEISITQNRNQVLFRVGNVELMSRLIEGQFPDYRRIMPAPSGNKVVVSTGEFLNANRTAAIFARDNSNIVRLQFAAGQEDLTPGKVTISATSAEIGDNVGEIDAVISGQPPQIAFNTRYLDELLRALEKSSQLQLEVSSSASPGTFRPVGDEGYLHIIMPMHTNR